MIHSFDPLSPPLASSGSLLSLQNTKHTPLSCSSLPPDLTCHSTHASKLLTLYQDIAAQSRDGGPQPPPLLPPCQDCFRCSTNTLNTLSITAHSASHPPDMQKQSFCILQPNNSLKIELLQPSHETEGLGHRRSSLSPEVVAAAAPTHSTLSIPPHSASHPPALHKQSLQIIQPNYSPKIKSLQPSHETEGLGHRRSSLSPEVVAAAAPTHSTLSTTPLPTHHLSPLKWQWHCPQNHPITTPHPPPLQHTTPPLTHSPTTTLPRFR